MSFSYGAATDKPTNVRKALDDQRTQILKGDAYNTSRAVGADDAAARRVELEDLSAAAHAAAEAAAKKLSGAAQYRLSVSGHHDQATGMRSVSVSVTAVP